MNATHSMEDFRKAYARGDMQEAERIYGCLLVSDARDGGHRPTNFEDNDAKGGRNRRGNRKNNARTRPETVHMVRLIAERPHSVRELGELVGLSTDEASHRLRSLRKNGFIERVGEETGGNYANKCAIYGPGERIAEWLRLYREVE